MKKKYYLSIPFWVLGIISGWIATLEKDTGFGFYALWFITWTCVSIWLFKHFESQEKEQVRDSAGGRDEETNS